MCRDNPEKTPKIPRAEKEPLYGIACLYTPHLNTQVSEIPRHHRIRTPRGCGLGQFLVLVSLSLSLFKAYDERMKSEFAFASGSHSPVRKIPETYREGTNFPTRPARLCRQEFLWPLFKTHGFSPHSTAAGACRGNVQPPAGRPHTADQVRPQAAALARTHAGHTRPQAAALTRPEAGEGTAAAGRACTDARRIYCATCRTATMTPSTEKIYTKIRIKMFLIAAR